jgi:alpha-beta hydrolase superfamily lysophospholipase
VTAIPALDEGVRPLTIRTEDGITLRGSLVPAARSRRPGPGERALTFVVAHGFTNGVARPSSLRVARWLRCFGDVRSLDFRGHGRSDGGSTVGGDGELRDLDAAVAAARADGADAVVTLGFSMGGGVALRQAALGRHRPDAVVSVSAVARWYVRETRPMRRVHWLLETTPGRLLGARLLGLRLGEPWDAVPVSPIEAASMVAPTPLLLIHGDRDTYFPVEHFRALVRAAGPSATALVVPGFGHAENGLTAPLVERIGRWASATIGG